MALRVRASRSKSSTLNILVFIGLLQVETCILFVTLPNKTIPTNEVSCKFMGGNSLRYATTLKSWVTIGILVVKRKNASSRT